MRRAYRLFAPAFALSTVGLLAVGPWPTFALSGGYSTLGTIALAGQVALTAFLVVSIEDFGDRTSGLTVVSVPELSYESYWRVIRVLYRRSFLAMLLSSFGIGVTSAILTTGLLKGYSDYTFNGRTFGRSNVAFYCLLVVTAVACLLLGVKWRGFVGWCFGFTLASLFVQIQLVEGIDARGMADFDLLAIAAVVPLGLFLRFLVVGVASRFRQRRAVPAAAPPTEDHLR